MTSKQKKINQRTVQALVAALTLGLAPFFPEPHLLGKLRWVAGGGVGMQPIDYFDLLLHGVPWVILTVMIFLKIRSLVTRDRG